MNHSTTTRQENIHSSSSITRCDFNSKQDQETDEHQHDMVMPGFRFHPTEEELVEFYLRRKVEGKRFNVELIAFLDLYRYDPWELPALAAIGEKEWYFYVPRDRKYRNGDRPNRVTASGYWKATGADRMIKSESCLRSIGLKKTLVFYSGKAPRGIRSSWIMNEYRLPQHETERLQKAEISLCRVYKRAGLEDHRSVQTRASSSSSSSSKKPHQPPHKQVKPRSIEPAQVDVFTTKTSQSISNDDDIGMTSLAITQQSSFTINPMIPMASSTSHAIDNDDLHTIVNKNNNNRYSQQASLISQENVQYPSNDSNMSNNLLSHLLPHQPTETAPHQQQQHNLVAGSASLSFFDRLWDWNNITMSEASKDYSDLF